VQVGGRVFGGPCFANCSPAQSPVVRSASNQAICARLRYWETPTGGAGSRAYSTKRAEQSALPAREQNETGDQQRQISNVQSAPKQSGKVGAAEPAEPTITIAYPPGTNLGGAGPAQTHRHGKETAKVPVFSALRLLSQHS